MSYEKLLANFVWNCCWTIGFHREATSFFFTLACSLIFVQGLIMTLHFKRQWSVEQLSEPMMAQAFLTSFCALDLVMMKSIWCQCFVLGCCHIPLYQFFIWNRVLVIRRLCSAHLVSRSWPFWLLFPIPLCPISVCISWSDPTWALKSPTINRQTISVWSIDQSLDPQVELSRRKCNHIPFH